MSVNLCLTIRFLQPYSHGRGDDGEPEWPPSPLRVFQALVAAAAGRWNERLRLEYAAPAMRWLERQPAPIIVAALDLRADMPYRLYVPDNVADKVARSWSRGAEASIAEFRPEKDVRATRLLGEVVHFLYAISPSDTEFETHRNVLIDASRSITHLGWGVDMVVGNGAVLSEGDATRLVGERWCPAEKAWSSRRRVPSEGTLDDLAAKHHAATNRLSEDGPRPVAPLTIFRLTGYRRANDPPTRRYVAFRLHHPTEDRAIPFAQTRANCVAAMTRHRVGRLAHEQGWRPEWIDTYVHGHRQKNDESLPRFSYLPLPSIESRGERGIVLGAIRRVLVAELIDSGESHLQWARQMLPGQFLTDDKTQDRRAMLAPLSAGDWVLQRYLASSDIWATVTPLVLPGSDDGKFAKSEKLFFKALHHAGYSPDLLAELDFCNVSFWPRGELALRFLRPDYLRTGCWSVHHVRLRWKHVITGPVAIGAGRHCGLGVFASLM